MPTKKTLGIFGGNPAKVRVFVKESPAQAAADYLLNVLEQMGNENANRYDSGKKKAVPCYVFPVVIWVI